MATVLTAAAAAAIALLAATAPRAADAAGMSVHNEARPRDDAAPPSSGRALTPVATPAAPRGSSLAHTPRQVARRASLWFRSANFPEYERIAVSYPSWIQPGAFFPDW